MRKEELSRQKLWFTIYREELDTTITKNKKCYFTGKGTHGNQIENLNRKFESTTTFIKVFTLNSHSPHVILIKEVHDLRESRKTTSTTIYCRKDLLLMELQRDENKDPKQIQ